MKVSEKAQSVVNSLVDRNVKPKCFSTVDGNINDLVQVFGFTLKDDCKTLMPYLVYYSPDKLTEKKDSKENQLAGSIFAMSIEHFKTIQEKSLDMTWITSFCVHNVIILSLGHISCLPELRSHWQDCYSVWSQFYICLA